MAPWDPYKISLCSVLISHKHPSRHVYVIHVQLGPFGGFQGDSMVIPWCTQGTIWRYEDA